MDNLKVLLVDDNVDFLIPLADELRETQNWLVDIYFTIADGITAAITGDYDIAMVDIVFPHENQNGVDFLKEVNKHKKDLPVILLTAYAEVNYAIDALRLGAADYIRKPFNVTEAVEVIKRSFSLKKLERQLHAISLVVETHDIKVGINTLAQNVLSCAQIVFSRDDLLFWITMNKEFNVTEFSSTIPDNDKQLINYLVENDLLAEYINNVVKTGESYGTSDKIDIIENGTLHSLGALILFPVVIKIDLTIIICAGRREPGHFDDSDIHFLTTIANIASIEIDRYQQWFKYNEAAIIKSEKEAELTKVRNEMEIYNTLLPGIAHHMHQPLTVIKGRVQRLLKKENIDKKQLHEELSSINKNAKKAEYIIKDMLDLNKISRVDLKKGDLVKLVKQCVKLVNEGNEIEGANNQIKIILILSSKIPLIKFDSQKLEMAIINLFDNAIQAIQVKINDEPSYRGRIDIVISCNDKEISIEIKDNGIGMTNEERHRIFEPLYSTKNEGHGLGLAVARMIAVSHGGRIEFQSSPNEGATFRLYLPVEKI